MLLHGVRMIEWVLAWLLSIWGAAAGGPDCHALVELDVQRSRAFASADVDALNELHDSPESAAGDVGLLESYDRRDLRLSGMVMVVQQCFVLARDDTHVWLRVVDRLGPTAVVDAAGDVRALPVDQPTERTIVLAQTPQGWRYAANY